MLFIGESLSKNQRIIKMNLSELRKIVFAALLAGVALIMLPACSSTEESSSSSAPPPSGGGTSYDQCIAACPDGDAQCKETCVQNLDI